MRRTGYRLEHGGGIATSLIACAAMLIVAACSRTAEPNLALACQVRPCECIPAKPAVFSNPKPKDVLWRLNGDAYCPKDHVLRQVDE